MFGMPDFAGISQFVSEFETKLKRTDKCSGHNVLCQCIVTISQGDHACETKCTMRACAFLLGTASQCHYPRLECYEVFRRTTLMTGGTAYVMSPMCRIGPVGPIGSISRATEQPIYRQAGSDSSAQCTLTKIVKCISTYNFKSFLKLFPSWTLT